MNLKVSYEYPHNLWSPPNVFNNFYNWMIENYSNHNFIYENLDYEKKRNPSGTHSAHIMTIRNLDNMKYFIVSYWDRAIDLTWHYNGWDSENMVELFTSAGVHQQMDFTPFSYVCYSQEFEFLSDSQKKPFDKKTFDGLLFRGYLYGPRKEMCDYKPQYFTQEKISPTDYFHELNNSRISLSLNGAGEICNRDMEILCCGSVLLRPELKQKFHDTLIPDYHYLSVENVEDPKLQIELLIKKYEETKDNHELLNIISRNGLDWFNKNGSNKGNVDVLKQIINLEKLQ